jgi:ribonuclease BN (tRNA processing enzyme)
LPVYSYRLVFPQQSIIVDTALVEKSGAGSNIVSFDVEAFARMEAAMTQASVIVITHEHMDHIGGLTAHPQLMAVLPAVRLVYVAAADGKEFLLIGDVAWHYRNIDTQRERARLMTWLLLKEDRSAVFSELAALKKLHSAEPNIQIIPGHDASIVDPLVATGALKAKFRAEATSN